MLDKQTRNKQDNVGVNGDRIENFTHVPPGFSLLWKYYFVEIKAFERSVFS